MSTCSGGRTCAMRERTRTRPRPWYGLACIGGAVAALTIQSSWWAVGAGVGWGVFVFVVAVWAES